MPVRGRDAQRREAVSPARVHLRAAREQEMYNVGAAVLASHVQGRLAVGQEHGAWDSGS